MAPRGRSNTTTSIYMDTDSTTLSAYSVVLRWVDGPPAEREFPMEAFTRAVSHDVQGHSVLLQHIISLKSIWHSSWPSIRLQRRRLYVTDLKPRIERDIRRITKLICFSKAEIGVFERSLLRQPTFADSDNITLDLLNQAQTLLKLLLTELETMPNQDDNVKDILTDEILEREDSPPSSAVTDFAQEHICRPSVVLRIPELEAKQIILKKPSGSPTLVSCKPRCAKCSQRKCRCWEKKRVMRNDSVFSVEMMAPP